METSGVLALATRGYLRFIPRSPRPYMFPTFTALSSAWLFLLTIPLVIFYFLKLRRPRQIIPSLVLWRQVIADQRVNSPFQRFKRNILLFLQLLLLALLILAAMQPVLRRFSSNATRLPVLIDVSASMGALDRPNGQTRLDAAKARVRDLIDNLPSDQEVTLIAFARTARRLTGFTNNKSELRDALASLQVEDVPGDLDDALRLAQAIARTASFDRIWLISDGNFPARTQFELSFQVDFQRVAPAGSNFGITACSARRSLGGQWDVFVQLGGSGEAESTTGTVELRVGAEVAGSERVALVKGSAPRLSFRIGSSEAAAVEVRFVPEGADSLAADNAAWLQLPAARPLSAFVPESLGSTRHAISAIDGVELYPGTGGEKLAGYDLVITDREADLATPARVLGTYGLVPEDLKSLVSIEKEPAHAIDWRRDHPLLQHVSLEDVVFSESPKNAPDVNETRIRELGYEILADGPHGPLIVDKTEADQLRLHTLFHPDRSTIVYRVGFPVFVSNLVQAALRRAQLSEVNAVATGVLPPIQMAAGQSVRIEGPARFSRTDTTGSDGKLSGVPAPKVGEYVINDGAATVRVGASLLSPNETSLAGVDQIEFAEQLKVSAGTTTPRVDRSLWWKVALAALGMLVVEWWWFNRRAVRA
jgi:Ca-activated chloride channel homolog